MRKRWTRGSEQPGAASGRTRRVIAAVCLATLPLLGGCQLLLIGGAAAAGAGAVVYFEGKLQQTLDAPLIQAHAAGVQALKDLGLPVREDRLDSRTAYLKSDYADGKDVWVNMEAVDDVHTKVAIRVGIMGDKERSLEILDRIKKFVASAPSKVILR